MKRKARELYGVSTVMLASALLAGCGSTGRDTGATLATIEPVAIPVASRALPPADIDQVLEQYRAVLEIAVDPQIRLKVQQRLAGLEMLRSEQRQIDGSQAARYFDQAIVLYQQLLDEDPDRPDNDRLLYQMAKAYEMDGRIEQSRAVLGRLAEQYPQSEYYIEASFRHGEMLFSQQRYAAAEHAYRAVVDAGIDNSYYNNAIYMLGWTLFKQSRYEASLPSFTLVLDQTIPADGALTSLSRAELEMVEDTLRVMSLVFSYLDGAATIKDYYAEHGGRGYSHLLYQRLGALYLEKERYRDSAATYLSFVQQYPDSDFAPQFSVRLIEVYQQGNFPSEILPAKESFTQLYGLYSDYWAGKDESIQLALKPYLHRYLQQLASHYHATAQLKQAELDAVNTQQGRDKGRAVTQREIRADFLTAGNWYAQFVETFPHDANTPGNFFLMAESLSEAGELPRAIAAYERVAYQYQDQQRGAEAGYSAILAYESYAATLSAQDRSNWHMQKIESELRFSEVYPHDARALPVLTKASEELLASGNARDAVSAASRVTAWQPVAEPGLRRTAWLVQGQGNFQLQNYGAAEASYGAALQLMQEQDEGRPATIDRLAASIYKQAEAHLAVAETSQAINDFLRVALVAPDSSIAISAHYDAANWLMEMQAWDRAEQEWANFRRRYPDHELSNSIAAKLTHIYQQQGHWSQAAAELTLIAAADPDAEVRRQSLYLAAELYQRDGAIDLAAQRYSDYTVHWPLPFDMATEARYQLSLLYEKNGNQLKRRVWLRELMARHDKAGSNASGRSRYLAAMSAAIFAEDAYRDFRAAPLTLPLKRSLKTKRTLMQASLAACERVLGYGVAEYVTEASYRIGEIYASLSVDLMASERPPELNMLELEQYEILLEEQAYPFEEQAIAIHETNARRSWSGVYDQWVQDSIKALASLMPARYGKSEKLVRVSDDIY